MIPKHCSRCGGGPVRAKGRCATCYEYFLKNGRERPRHLFEPDLNCKNPACLRPARLTGGPITRCSSCHRPTPPAAFISPHRVRPCSTCATCRAAVEATRERRNEGRVRNYEIPYFRLDRAGLGCLNCPLERCVWEVGGSDPRNCPL